MAENEKLINVPSDTISFRKISRQNVAALAECFTSDISLMMKRKERDEEKF